MAEKVNATPPSLTPSSTSFALSKRWMVQACRPVRALRRLAARPGGIAKPRAQKEDQKLDRIQQAASLPAGSWTAGSASSDVFQLCPHLRTCRRAQLHSLALCKPLQQHCPCGKLRVGHMAHMRTNREVFLKKEVIMRSGMSTAAACTAQSCQF